MASRRERHFAILSLALKSRDAANSDVMMEMGFSVKEVQYNFLKLR